jgi:hypothetical protein
MQDTRFIIARYNEDISWSKELKCTIIQKDVHLPNKGREPSSYLWYILRHYEALSGVYTFSQGKYSDHCRSLLTELPSGSESFIWHGDETLTSSLTGAPHDNCNVQWFLEQNNLKVSGPILFKPGCIFSVSAERIRKYPKEFYQKMYDILMSEENRSPWSFERCVGLIWGD